MEQILCFSAVSGKVRGDYIHVVARADGFFLLRYLHGVQVCNFSLDGFDGLVLVDTADMQVHNDTTVRLHEIRKHTVVEFRRQNLQE